MANSVIEVSCAIIESAGRVLVAQRGAGMAHPLKWEFPGGKWEAGESAEGALIREITEELGLNITIVEALEPSFHTYDQQKAIRLWPFRCNLLGGQLQLLEHAQANWFEWHELAGLDWAAADIPIVKQYIRQRHEGF